MVPLYTYLSLERERCPESAASLCMMSKGSSRWESARIHRREPLARSACQQQALSWQAKPVLVHRCEFCKGSFQITWRSLAKRFPPQNKPIPPSQAQKQLNAIPSTANTNQNLPPADENPPCGFTREQLDAGRQAGRKCCSPFLPVRRPRSAD